MDKEKVLNLAKLARIEIGEEEEAENLTREFGAILGYVGEIKGLTNTEDSNESRSGGLSNVFRADGKPHESGLYTEKILAQAPATEGRYIKVKKIL